MFVNPVVETGRDQTIRGKPMEIRFVPYSEEQLLSLANETLLGVLNHESFKVSCNTQ
jgi:hypothetical protein